MFFRRIYFLFGGKCLKCSDYAEAGVARLNNIVNIAILRGIVWIGKLVFVFFFAFLYKFFALGRIGYTRQLFIVKYFNGSLWTHYSNFSTRPCIVDVATQMFRTHYTISSAVSFAQNNSYFGNSCFAISVK